MRLNDQLLETKGCVMNVRRDENLQVKKRKFLLIMSEYVNGLNFVILFIKNSRLLDNFLMGKLLHQYNN